MMLRRQSFSPPSRRGWGGCQSAIAAVCRGNLQRLRRSSSLAASLPSLLVVSPLPAADAEEEDPLVRRRRTEAVLLLHRGPVNLRKLATLAMLSDATEARTRIRELNELYLQTGSALWVEEVAGGHQLLTRPGLAPWLRRIRHVPPPVQLGEAALETLAIVAYRQPVLRADIEAIRGVACGELVRQLMNRDLVRICGRSEELGRPYLYGTTPYFLQVFGLKNLGSIPGLPGSTIPDDSEDSLANPENPGKASDGDSPIERSMKPDRFVPHSSPFDVTTRKESDVSTAPGPVVLDEVAVFLNADSALAVADRPSSRPSGAIVMSDDDDDDYYDDDEEEDDDEGVDDDIDADWEEDDDEDEDEDDDEEDGWEVVGDDDGDEDDDEEEEEEGDADADADSDEADADGEEEDDDWDDDEDDWDEDEDEDEEEWD